MAMQPERVCWGCVCDVPIVGDCHEEETDIPNTVYRYPCTRPRDADRGEGADLVRGAR